MQRTSVGTPFRMNDRRRGFVLITMGFTVIALVGVLGMALDIGRMFIAKNETQAFCDSAALAAALALDGTTVGIAAGQTALANSTNSWNLDSTKVASPTLTFATSLAGPWVANPNPATGYIYAKVSTTVPVKLYLMPIVVPKTTQDVIASATAGQINITTFPEGLSPYTAVSTDPLGPNFGLTVGKVYDIQWPALSAGGCDPAKNGYPDNCFIKPPCGDEPLLSKIAVVTNWGSSNSGYWGATSNSVIEQEIVNLNAQTTPVSVGDNIQPVLTNGQKQSQSQYLDERVNQDIEVTYNLVGTPLTSGTYLGTVHNGRRLLPVPIVDPTDPSHTTVLGFGQFLLYTNGSGSDYYKKAANGNDPFCAIYAGPYQIGSISPGAGGSTGATRVKLVQ
jgi:Flp pilus assembly protein TadG